MTKLQDKAQAQVKQMVGQMIGDEKLVLEGREQQLAAQGHDVREANQKEKARSRNRSTRETKKKS